MGSANIPPVGPVKHLFPDGINPKLDSEYILTLLPPSFATDTTITFQKNRWRNKLSFGPGMKHGFNIDTKIGPALMAKEKNFDEISNLLLKTFTKLDVDFFHSHAKAVHNDDGVYHTERAFNYLYELIVDRDESKCYSGTGIKKQFLITNPGCKIQATFRNSSDTEPANRWIDGELCESDADNSTEICSQHESSNDFTALYYVNNEGYQILQLLNSNKKGAGISLLLDSISADTHMDIYVKNKARNSWKPVLTLPKMLAVEQFLEHLKEQFAWVKTCDFKKHAWPFMIDVLLNSDGNKAESGLSVEDLDMSLAFRKLRLHVHLDYFQKFTQWFTPLENVKLNFFDSMTYAMNYVAQLVTIGVKTPLFPEPTKEAKTVKLGSYTTIENPEISGNNITIANLSKITRTYLNNLKSNEAKQETQEWIRI